MIKLGVTGKTCSGKDTFAQQLVARGYTHLSLSDIVREEAERRGVELTRQSLRQLGNELRASEGAGVLAKRALAKMKPHGSYVITSVRNPGEIQVLLQSKNFALVTLDAPERVRFERLVARGRQENDPDTFEEFLECEKEELESRDESNLNLQACIDVAQYTLMNEGTREEFLAKIEAMLPQLEEAAAYTRPSWDEYFMDLVMMVGRRGTCSRGRSGCLLVRDKRILSTGYVGSPPGLQHCDDIGHLLKRMVHEDGRVSQHCLRTVHAEANAIAHAARHGIAVGGATLYCKMEPCLDCAKLLISAGIRRVVCAKRYHGATDSRKMLDEAGLRLEVLQDEVEPYTGQTGET